MKNIQLILLLICFSLLSTGVLFAQPEKQDEFFTALEDLLNTDISTASKYEQTTSKAPASVTIIPADDIERYGYRTLSEVLLSVRGFYLSNDRNYSYVGVRGFSRPTDYNNRILLLVNGHSVNEGIFGSASVGTELGLNLKAVERIEIVRGPGSALYGTNAMLAVINIITKDGNTVDGFRFSGESSSYGRLQGAGIYGKKLNNGVEAFVSGQWADIAGGDIYFTEYDDPSTNNGIATNLDWEKYHGFLTTLNYNSFTFQGMVTSREKGVPTGAWEVDFNDNTAKTFDEFNQFELKYDDMITVDKNIMVRGYFDYYQFRAGYPYDGVLEKEAGNGSMIGGELQFRWDMHPSNRLTIGGEYQNHFKTEYKYWAPEEVYIKGDFPYNIASFYIQDEYQAMENLSLTFGIRHDDYSTVGNSTTPRGAMIYNPIKSSTVKLLYGEAFRAPNVYEYNWEEEDSWKRNESLKPEKIRTLELVWEQRLSYGLITEVSAYNFRMSDLIDEFLDPTDSLGLYRNISKVVANGLELGLIARLNSGFIGHMSYTYQDVKDNETKDWLTNSPNHIWKMGASSPVTNHFRVAAELIYETERLTVYETETDPYLLTNMRFTADPHLEGNNSWVRFANQLQASFTVRNLFDESYSTPGGYEHYQSSITQDGRNYSIMMGLKF
ncbi:MAG: TonB-dependent receptor [candidate division Zixibacteria bacterium]|nr:TonB-dependent receptor [candidate division Zixibacteria bacterium]